MANVPKAITDLPVASAMGDDDLLVVSQNATTSSIKGELIKGYAQNAVASQVTAAQTAATQASQSATQAEAARQGAAAAQTAAENAQDAAETARDQSVAAAGTIGDSVEQAKTAAGQASSAKDAAVAAQTAAETAKTAAETASGQAQTAATQASGSATAAQTAATQAGDAKTDAETARNEAETSASSAANSASDAESAATEAEQAKTYIENMDMEGETLPAGSSVTVTKTTSPEGNLLFVIGVPQGIQGDKGDTGETGATGPQGVSVDRVEKTSGTGEPGTTDTYTIYLTDGSSYPFQVLNGPQGPQGNGLTIKYTYDTLEELEAAVPSPERGMNAYIGTGEPYDVYTYTQTSSGNQWTNGGPLQGPAGATGPAGVGISSINRTGGTGAAGSLDTYTVTLSDGSSYQFTVQNGTNGAAGPAGADGVSPTVSVSQISGGHQVSITDATGSHTFDVMDGQNGATGPAGADGAAATIESVSAVTGEPGTQASVVNNGTSSAAELVFTLPAGADGAQGPAGTAGADGQSAYEAAQEGGYTGSESQFNTDLAGVSSKQRVVDLGILNFNPESSSNVITADLASEQINDVFLDNQAPIVLFELQGTSIQLAVLLGLGYTKGDRIAEGYLVGQDNNATNGSLWVGLVAIHGTEDGTGTISLNSFQFFSGISNGAVVSSNPIQLPADPTSEMQAATKQYVDNLVGTINTTLDTINGEVV